MVPIAQVLADYGYNVRPDGDLREQQFSCNLHGDGWDTKPSARVYPESGSWYCFACDISRDPISTVRGNEGLSFWEAVRKLERAYGLPPLPWDDDDDESTVPSTRAVVEANLRPGKTFDDDTKRYHTLLDGEVQARDVPLEVALSYWEAFDKIVFHVKGVKGRGGPWTEKTGRLVLEQLRTRLMGSL
jgi:hypothetical protein